MNELSPLKKIIKGSSLVVFIMFIIEELINVGMIDDFGASIYRTILSPKPIEAIVDFFWEIFNYNEYNAYLIIFLIVLGCISCVALWVLCKDDLLLRSSFLVTLVVFAINKYCIRYDSYKYISEHIVTPKPVMIIHTIASLWFIAILIFVPVRMIVSKVKRKKAVVKLIDEGKPKEAIE